MKDGGHGSLVLLQKHKPQRGSCFVDEWFEGKLIPGSNGCLSPLKLEDGLIDFRHLAAHCDLHLYSCTDLLVPGKALFPALPPQGGALFGQVLEKIRRWWGRGRTTKLQVKSDVEIVWQSIGLIVGLLSAKQWAEATTRFVFKSPGQPRSPPFCLASFCFFVTLRVVSLCALFFSAIR